MSDNLDPKSSYKELLRHVSCIKREIDSYIINYESGSKYGKLFINLKKDNDRKDVLIALNLLQEELEKINV